MSANRCDYAHEQIHPVSRRGRFTVPTADLSTLVHHRAKIAVAEFSQVCYTLLTRGVRSRNRLLCAFEGAIVLDISAITTYTASLICALCFALEQTDLQHHDDDIDNLLCVAQG